MAVIQIFRAECGGQITLLLQDLQVQHYGCKNGEHPCQQVSVHQEYTNVHKVKAEKRRIAAVPVNTTCHKLRSVAVWDTGPPTVLHADNGEQEDQVAKHADAEPGKAGACRQMTPPESDGQQLRGDDPHGGDPHQHFDGVRPCVLPASDLHGSDAASLLHPLLDEINAIKYSQDEQCREAVRYVSFY